MIPWQFRLSLLRAYRLSATGRSTGMIPWKPVWALCSEQRWPEMLQSNSQVDVSLPCLEAGRKQHGTFDNSLDTAIHGPSSDGQPRRMMRPRKWEKKHEKQQPWTIWSCQWLPRGGGPSFGNSSLHRTFFGKASITRPSLSRIKPWWLEGHPISSDLCECSPTTN